MKTKIKLLYKGIITTYQLKKLNSGYIISITERDLLLFKKEYECTSVLKCTYKEARRIFDILHKNKVYACQLNDIVHDLCVENMKNK